MTVLEGQPTALLERANGYLTSAALIEAAADDLRSLAAAGTSLALDQVNDQAAATVVLLEVAHGRYDGTAQALRDYAVSLQDAHARAEHAAASMAWSSAQLSEAGSDVQRYDVIVDAMRDDPMTQPGSISYYEDLLSDARYRQSQLEGTLHSSHQEVQAARGDMESAARLAIARIDAAISDTNNHGIDRILKAVDDVRDAVADLWNAFVEFIAKVVEAVVTAILAVVAALVVLALVVVAIVVLLALIVALAIIVAVAVWVLLSALVAILTSPWFWLAVLVIAAVVAIVLLRALADTQKPTPEVRPYSSRDANDSERLAHKSSQQQTEMAGLGEFLETAAYVDRLGGDRPGEADHKSVVDIKNMGGEPPRWVVTMPSTQDWQALGLLFGQIPGVVDAGSVTDVDTNVALMAFPELRTQYERAVLEAMRSAGIGPDDPVMLVGFSQGGILAGHLAANRSEEFNFVRVIAAGAPIDHLDFPEHSRTGERVHILSIQHEGDPVPEADLTAPSTDVPHVQGFHEIARDRFGEVVEGADSHHVGLYQATLERLAEQDPGLEDPFSDFMGPVVDHKQYEFAE